MRSEKNQKLLITLCICFLLSVSSGTFAGVSDHPLSDVNVTQDKAALKRGAMIYYNSCRMCHSMKYIRYQNLAEIGFSDSEINGLRGDRLKTETLTSTSSDENLTHLYGLIPPDLSVMAKARKKGARYIYTLMTSYYEESKNVYENKLYPGIKMPDVFSYSVALSAEEKEDIENRALDVTEFLVWSSDPKAHERKSLGKYVIAYFILLSVMLYFVMKRVWRRLDKV